MGMELLRLVQVLLLFLSAVPFISSYETTYSYNWLLIDCGSTNETSTTTSRWHTDEDFIRTGQNVLLTPNQNFNTMNTLRFFPNGNRNCYKIPLVSADHKFLFRAGFFYANYDGLSRPPSFILEIDGNLWANVTTSMSEDEPIYFEMIYRTKEEQATVCLVRTSVDQTPFISSLEATFITEDMYKLMENKTALYLHSRINYGANRSIEKLIDSIAECCNRMWKSKQLSEYFNITSQIIPDGSLLEENSPPWPVMATAIQAKNITDSIYLSVDFSPQTELTAYIVLYFMDPIIRYPPNVTSKVEIYIDSKKLDAREIPDWGGYNDGNYVVSFYPVRVFGAANVTISPVEGSTLAPVLNAMEVFYVIDVSNSKERHVLCFSLPVCVILLHLIHILFSY